MSHECLFKHTQGGDVEVVGGLVQQQHVGVAEEQAGKNQAILLSA